MHPGTAAPTLSEAAVAASIEAARRFSLCLERSQSTPYRPLPAQRAVLPWSAAWALMYALIKRSRASYDGRFSILDTQYVAFGRSPLVSAFSSAVPIYVIDPCQLSEAQSADGRMTMCTCKYTCCTEVAKQQPGGGFPLIVGHGSLGIDDCSDSLQHGGLFVAENATLAIFDGLSQFAVKRMEADVHCEFRSIAATVRMVMVEKCLGQETGTDTSSQRAQIGRVDDLSSVLSDSLQSENIPPKHHSCFDPFLFGLTMLLGLDFNQQPLQVLVLQASVADVCVLAALFSAAHVVAAPAQEFESGWKCSSGSNPRIEVRQPAPSETFDVVVEMLAPLNAQLVVTEMDHTADSFDVSLRDALSKVKDGAWLIAMHSCRGPVLSFARFLALARLLAAEALPVELSDVVSIHVYNGSAFVRKVHSQHSALDGGTAFVRLTLTCVACRFPQNISLRRLSDSVRVRRIRGCKRCARS
jgi:hypothetical protein